MPTVETKLRDLLVLAQTVMDELPVGLLVLSSRGTPMWFNREAEIVCAVWNRIPLRVDALPLKRVDFAVPLALWRECQSMLMADEKKRTTSEARLISEPERGLHARIRLQRRMARRGTPACFIQLDYRRSRSDRERPLSPSSLGLLSRLTFQEREVALRIREGLSTAEIARDMRRSRFTIKTQLAAIFRKLMVTNRSRVTAMLS